MESKATVAAIQAAKAELVKLDQGDLNQYLGKAYLALHQAEKALYQFELAKAKKSEEKAPETK